ncbi:DUF7662 domain-containing protein [Mycobacterium sp.]|uniref:DUF7662 domain-containing protein n=1 Tax=Mycobacterium sp. TaxID=1785 RepID=UPI003F989478
MTNEARWSARELKSELNRYEEELRAAGKTRNTINTYVQHPERFIKWLDRNRPTQADAKPGGYDCGTSKYDPLKKYLAERTDPVIHLSFGEIERIIGRPLPASARLYRAWWANERDSHVHASAWMEAGRRTTKVDLNADTVDFVQPRIDP